MEIVIADITDIKDLAFVEIASKKASIPQLINGQDIDAESQYMASWYSAHYDWLNSYINGL